MPRAADVLATAKIRKDLSHERLALIDAFAKYADHAAENYSLERCMEFTHSLKLLTSYLTDDLDESPLYDHGTLGITQRPADILDKLDDFFRYHLLREMITNPIERKSIRNNIFDIFKWLETGKLLSQERIDAVKSLGKRLNVLDQSAVEAQKLLVSSLRKKKPKGGYTETMEFGRHDVSKIEDTNIWLEIWSLMILPDETNIGPIAVPPAVASLLEPGWMIASELGKRRDGQWEFTEVTSILPSLPFK